MLKSATRLLALGLASLLAAAPAPAAQPAAAPGPARPAAWTEDSHEPLCVFEGLLATEGGIETAEVARAIAVVAECRARFGWTEAQGRQGVAVTGALIAMHNTRAAALAAGVTPQVLREVFESFTAQEILSMSGQSPNPSERGLPIGVLVVQRLDARGLRGEQADKAATALMSRLVSVRVGLEFAAEIGFPRGD